MAQAKHSARSCSQNSVAAPTGAAIGFTHQTRQDDCMQREHNCISRASSRTQLETLRKALYLTKLAPEHRPSRRNGFQDPAMCLSVKRERVTSGVDRRKSLLAVLTGSRSRCRRCAPLCQLRYEGKRCFDFAGTFEASQPTCVWSTRSCKFRLRKSSRNRVSNLTRPRKRSQRLWLDRPWPAAMIARTDRATQ